MQESNMYDYEIEEIMRIRKQISDENKNDLNNLAKYYRKIEKELKNSGKYKFIDRTYNSSHSQSIT
jgi:hypothetical protein